MMTSSMGADRLRLVIAVLLALGFAAICAAATYGYLDRRVDVVAMR